MLNKMTTAALAAFIEMEQLYDQEQKAAIEPNLNYPGDLCCDLFLG